LLTLGDEVVTELVVPLHRQVEITAADQFAIAEFARRIAGHGDDAIVDQQPRILYCDQPATAIL
jgi:hypothetical protein